ncbi:hypothetical protein LOF27_03140, partial [Xanthomonas euvesicatoria]|uniref:hypothetical protein n=1 Tax=Xanthomonas euvesicatoria TaxID=456327 RepID=UPI0024057751
IFCLLPGVPVPSRWTFQNRILIAGTLSLKNSTDSKATAFCHWCQSSQFSNPIRRHQIPKIWGNKEFDKIASIIRSVSLPRQTESSLVPSAHRHA